MKFIRKKVSFVSLFMVTVMLSITVPYQPLLAAMVSTEAIIDLNNAEEARDYLKCLISRDDIRELLIKISKPRPLAVRLEKALPIRRDKIKASS
jgi:hypothetical protein